jgi:hypothetical protein
MGRPADGHELSRRALVATIGALALTGGCARADARDLTVYKTPWCGCCREWVVHMTRAGFRPRVVEVEDLAPVREKHGIPFVLSSCHTGLVGGYVVEGHVPATDVARLLDERPAGLGLVVPGMPLGSPGMEQPDGSAERFETLLLLDRSGRTRVFAVHG